MSEKDPSTNPDERKIATTVSELPDIPEDHVRVVHICWSEGADHIKEIGGLDYTNYAMAMSTARAYSKAEDVEYGSTDRRFSSPEQKCVVFHMTNAEWKLHNDIRKAPGLIPLSQLVGIVPANQDKKL